MTTRRSWFLLMVGCLTAGCILSSSTRADDEPRPIAPSVAGHVHPSICRTRDGALVVVYKGPNVLHAIRSTDEGRTWSAPSVIAASAVRPDSIREVKIFEVYPGTLDRLPDGRLLTTWNYIADDKKTDGYYERALLYSVSDDQGLTWSEQRLIGPVDGHHLGAVRHNVLAGSDGRWLLPLRVGPPRWFDSNSGQLEVFPLVGPDGKQHAFQQIVRTPRGTLLAMGPVFLRSTDQGKSWQQVESFRPVATTDNAEGRYLTVLDDGRIFVTWGDGRANKGLRFDVSTDDGQTWDLERSVVLLPDRSITAHYYSPRAIQLDDKRVAVVFVSGGVHFLEVAIERLFAR